MERPRESPDHQRNSRYDCISTVFGHLSQICPPRQHAFFCCQTQPLAPPTALLCCALLPQRPSCHRSGSGSGSHRGCSRRSPSTHLDLQSDSHVVQSYTLVCEAFPRLLQREPTEPYRPSPTPLDACRHSQTQEELRRDHPRTAPGGRRHRSPA